MKADRNTGWLRSPLWLMVQRRRHTSTQDEPWLLCSIQSMSQITSLMVINIQDRDHLYFPFLCTICWCGSVSEARQGHGEGQAAAGWDRQLRGQGNNQINRGNAVQECDLLEVVSNPLRINRPVSRGWLDYEWIINSTTWLRNVMKRQL